ncbi:hypothetical protein VB780_05495 [Leptolyngbya sp. CCNP1308]|uniref:hypothetical protein n=1 Tax=Leptolyngbya sp. CCNP1308 TaxID=3110255 RepID=UPI002B21BCE2|nr:hypothetical protein [Leptolyngbya sp. CCNP1308]MEA5448014.1 hypothetical protein [Leptolyngbya sp. CCNP1308]
MNIEVQRYLYDIQAAGEAIQTFVAGQTFDNYRADAMLRSPSPQPLTLILQALRHKQTRLTPTP